MTKPQLPKEVEEAFDKLFTDDFFEAFQKTIYHIENDALIAIKSFIAEQLEKQRKVILQLLRRDK